MVENLSREQLAASQDITDIKKIEGEKRIPGY